MYAIRSYYGLVKAETDRLGQVHRRQLIAGGNGDEALTEIEFGGMQTLVLAAEDQGHPPPLRPGQKGASRSIGMQKIRITSYNVCYTKLLRSRKAPLIGQYLQIFVPRKDPCIQHHRSITQ